MTLRPHHLRMIDLLAAGHRRACVIARLTRTSVQSVHARMSELRKAGVVRATESRQRCMRGRPPKLYRLNVWSEKP